jgi:phage baseplate assembly protein W
MSQFRQDKFTPTTVQTLLYSDLFDDFTVHPELHDLVIKKNEESVKQSILNLILTNKYDRPFQPNIGGNLRNYLFEPITPITQSGIEIEIESIITNHEPRARLISVAATPYEEKNLYVITIQFYIVNINNAVTLTTILYRVR